MHKLVPAFILENYQAEIYRGILNTVGMLVDLSGFSRMTDTLAQHEPHGSEVLANGMRRVFDPMIERVFKYGGFVIGFAGDAITALFPFVEEDDENHIQALTAATEIQNYIREHPLFDTPYGQFEISAKIGLGAGKARWRIVRSTDHKRATYYFRGSAISFAIQSLSLAKAGEVFLCPTLQKRLSPKVEGKSYGEYLRVENFVGQPAKPQAINIPKPDHNLLQIFCSELINPHEQKGEFRPAVNLFINIPQDQDSENSLRPFIQTIFRLQERYGGLFSRLDFGDKGTSLLMFWGAPVAQENDIQRALTFIHALARETDLSVKAGVTYRLAYTGFVGGELQEEYTCYGWGVNLAARLMTSAKPGEILVDEEIARQAKRRYNLQLIGKQSFKGFSQEQSVFKLLDRRSDERTVFSGEFVGREKELETLSRFVSPIWSGQFSGILTVIGDPGIGKSRLLNAFQQSLKIEDRAVQWAICQTDDIARQSLNPFRYWLRQYFDIFETRGEVENKNAFDQKISTLIQSTPYEELARELDRTRSCLGELVDLHWADSLYERLDAQGRYDNTFIALASLLRIECLRQPVILQLEDMHLADNDSRAFLGHLRRILIADNTKTYPFAIVATARRERQKIVLDDLPCDEIDLTALSDTDLVHLTETLLGGKAAPSLLKILAQRAEGNPFFAEQIVRYLIEEQKLESGAKGWEIAGGQTLVALPTDVNAILIARLDKLNREVKEVVQTASVLGREFELRLLSKMLRDDETLPQKAQLAIEADIFAILNEIRYIFRHALVRDTAYNMLLRANQQEIHRTAVQAYETLYQEQLSPHYSEIAYHAEKADMREKARHFYRLAGKEAAKAYQNSLALESFTRALALTSMNNTQERIELLLEREALFSTTGDRDGQAQDLATLELLAEQQADYRNRAIVALRQASFSFDTGDYSESVSIAQNAIDFANLANAKDIAVVAYKTLPIALSRQGKNKAAIQSAETGIKLAHEADNKVVEGQILNDLGLINIEMRRLESTRLHFENSLRIAQQAGHRRLEAQVHNNLGNLAGMFELNYSDASRHYEKTLEIVREIGNRIGEGFAFGNLGWVASMQGDFERARQYQAEALSIARETGNRYQEAYCLINLSAIAVSQENYLAGLEHTQKSLLIAEKIGERSGEAWALTYLGHSHLGLNELKSAMKAYQAAVNIRRELEQPPLLMEPLAGMIQVFLKQKDYDSAFAHCEEILTYLSSGGTLDGAEEPVRVYLTIYQTLVIRHDPRANKILRAAHELLQTQISRIQDENNRTLYVQNVPWRRELMEIWENLNG